ncbi:hypothetical protein ACSSS7_006913 [Eimeria intestinalis]
MEATPAVDEALPSASFICESCSRPLIIIDDASSTFSFGVAASNREEELDPCRFLEQGERNARISAASFEDGEELQCATGESFVVLPAVRESHGVHAQPTSRADGNWFEGSSLPTAVAETVSARIKRLLREAADGEGWSIPHPVCCGCLDAAIAELEPVSAHEERLIRKYEKALKRLGGERPLSSRSAPSVPPLPIDATSAESELQKLAEEEEQLLKEIADLEESTVQKENEQLQVVAELAELHMWQLEFWLLFGNHSQRAARHEERKRAMERLFAYVSQELQRLKRTNVVNDAFHIWTWKFLPSINNCRIGRVSSPSCPSWAEINTGWGYLCLLLDVFYRKCRTQPSNYRLVPRGQFSFLIRKRDGVMLPLHGGGGEAGLSRFFYSNKRFDAAMTSFLECVKELFDRLLDSAHHRRGQPNALSLLPIPELPYDIEGDRVGGFSIRLQLNQDERWTRALKHLLIDMKSMLEYIEREHVQLRRLGCVSLVTGSAP